MLRKLFISCVLISLAGCATPQENLNIDPAVIIKKAIPAYPPQARASKTEGWVWVRYTVTDEGIVIDPKVTESSPEGVFDNSALLAIYQFKYIPRKVNGNATSITGMTYRFDFQL